MKVIGIGDNVMDMYLNKNVMYPGGQALNFSAYAARQGFSSAYMGVFGTDSKADYVKKVCGIVGVDISHAVTKEGENGYAQVNIVDGDRVFIGGNRGGISRMDPLVIQDADLEYLRGFAFAHSSNNGAVEKELPKLKEIGLPLSFDYSSWSDDEYIASLAPYITVGFISLSDLSLEEVKTKIQWMHGLGITFVCATMGSDGSILYDGKDFFRKESDYVEPVDTMGAGDSFQSAFMCNYVQYCQDNGMKPFDRTEENHAEAIRYGLKQAAAFAAGICKIDGAYGYGTPIA